MKKLMALPYVPGTGISILVTQQETDHDLMSALAYCIKGRRRIVVRVTDIKLRTDVNPKHSRHPVVHPVGCAQPETVAVHKPGVDIHAERHGGDHFQHHRWHYVQVVVYP